MDARSLVLESILLCTICDSGRGRGEGILYEDEGHSLVADQSVVYRIKVFIVALKFRRSPRTRETRNMPIMISWLRPCTD